MVKNDNNLSPKNAENFICEKCDYKCSKNSDWLRHISTRKHINDNLSKIAHICICGKQYSHSSGLSRHKNFCEILNKNTLEESIKKLVINTLAQNNFTNNNNNILVSESVNTISMLVKQNQDFQKEMFGQIIEFVKTNNNTINNGTINNTQFNLQVYLNETCKNAMNIDQFIEYLQPTLQELEDTARLGYVEGITRIIMRGLKDLEENERPFHCSDLKRETMFVKNNNDIWEKEPDEKPQLMKVVKAISRKNFCNVSAWQKEHPTWRSSDSKHNDQYNQILVNSTSGSTEKEQQESYEKIIKNIVKESVIDKSKKK